MQSQCTIKRVKKQCLSPISYALQLYNNPDFFFFYIYNFFPFHIFFQVTGVLLNERTQDAEYIEAVLRMVKKGERKKNSIEKKSIFMRKSALQQCNVISNSLKLPVKGCIIVRELHTRRCKQELMCLSVLCIKFREQGTIVKHVYIVSIKKIQYFFNDLTIHHKNN